MFEFTTSARSKELFFRALQVITRHRKLLVFPVLSSVLGLSGVCLFVVPFLASGVPVSGGQPWVLRLEGVWSFFSEHRHLTNADFDRFFGSPRTMMLFGLCLALALVLPVLAGLLNAAFYSEGIKALAGEEVSVRRGLLAAVRRFRPLLNWFLVGGLVTLLIQSIFGRLGWAGRLAGLVAGLSWSAASFFVIPIIMREDSPAPDPLALVKASTGLLRKTWGESIVGYAGISSLGLPVLAAVLAVGILVRASPLELPVPLIVGALALGLGCTMILSNAIGGIYRCALYVYASEGVIPAPFSVEQLDAAWKVKTPGRS